MSRRKHLVDLDLYGNYLKNFGVEVLPSLPTDNLFDGRLVVVDDTLYQCVYTNNVHTWKKVSNSGPEGLQGVQGLKGDKGLQGNQGPQGNQGLQGVQGLKGTDGSVTSVTTSGSGNGVSNVSVQGGVLTQQKTNFVPGTSTKADIRDLESTNITVKNIQPPGYNDNYWVGTPDKAFGIMCAKYIFGKYFGNENGTLYDIGSNTQPIYFEDGIPKACTDNFQGPRGLQGVQGHTGPQGPQGPAGSSANMEIYSLPESLYRDIHGIGCSVWDIKDLEENYGGRTYSSASYELLNQSFGDHRIAIRVGGTETRFEHYLMLINDDSQQSTIEFALGVIGEDSGGINLVHNFSQVQTVIVAPNSYVEVSVVCKKLQDANHGQYITIIATRSSDMVL